MDRKWKWNRKWNRVGFWMLTLIQFWEYRLLNPIGFWDFTFCWSEDRSENVMDLWFRAGSNIRQSLKRTRHTFRIFDLFEQRKGIPTIISTIPVEYRSVNIVFLIFRMDFHVLYILFVITATAFKQNYLLLFSQRYLFVLIPAKLIYKKLTKICINLRLYICDNIFAIFIMVHI